LFLLWVGHPPYFMLEPIKFVVVSCWVSMGQEDGRLSCCFVLPMVDLCLSLLGDFLLLVVVLWGALVLVVVCLLFLCFLFAFNFTLEIVRYWWSVLQTLFFFWTFSCTLFIFIFIYNIFVTKKNKVDIKIQIHFMTSNNFSNSNI
jgi:hypothetical protein